MDASPDEVAAWAAYAPVEQVVPFLLLALDRESLSTDGKLDLLVGVERLKAWADAEQVRTLASLGAEPAAFPAAQGKEFVREEIAAALHWSAGTASVRLHDAETMVEALPATVALLADGDVSYAHARAVADAVQRNVLDAARRSRQTPHRRLPDRRSAARGCVCVAVHLRRDDRAG